VFLDKFSAGGWENGKVKSVLSMPAEVGEEDPTDAYVNDSQATESRQDSMPLCQDISSIYIHSDTRACLAC